jgi:hypothetical protein
MKKNNSWLAEKKRIDSRVNWMIKNGINHWAGTISPAPKSSKNNEIESLEEAINFYRSYGVDQVNLQIKYMGSYCAIYLHRDINETKFFTRNGFLINHLDREKLIKATQPLYDKLEQTFSNDIEYIIIETELLPWRALGDGLVEREYVNYYNLNKDFLDYKKNNPELFIKINKTLSSPEYEKYMKGDENKQHIIRQYNGLTILNHIFVDAIKEEESLNIYKNQLDFFGYKSEDFEFKGFNIIKAVFFDGSQMFYNNNYNSFKTLNDDETIIINLETDDYLEKAYNFFNEVNHLGLEGIMVKPLHSRLVNLPHAFKVRNNNYLQLIYGVKFDINYDYYFEKRNIKRKLQSSINEYELNLMLSLLKKDELIPHNKDYSNLLYNVLEAEIFNKTLDNRL